MSIKKNLSVISLVCLKFKFGQTYPASGPIQHNKIAAK